MYYDGFSLGRVKQDNMSDICLKVDTCILFCPLDQGSGSQNVLLVCPICLSFCLHIFLFLPLTFKLYNS